jgi:hypothetical protein
VVAAAVVFLHVGVLKTCTCLSMFLVVVDTEAVAVEEVVWNKFAANEYVNPINATTIITIKIIANIVDIPFIL